MQTIFEQSYLFLSIYLTGLALNLTPCVYPMMSVTVSLFGFRQETKRTKSFLRALLYVMGLSTMFSALGLSAAVGGAIFGQWLQNPVVLTAIGIFILALSLSMLGVYSFQLPSGLVNSLAKKTTASGVGMYLAGLMAGIFAAPCIGPPLIALMTVVATKGNTLFALWVFFIMSLGLGTPYLILGTFSGLLKKLPRSGVWLLWVERFLGVILFCISIFYLTIAWAPQLLPFLTPASFIAGGIYLGFFVKTAQSSKIFLNFKRSIGALAVVIGILILSQSPRDSVRWEVYEPQKLVAARQTSRPVAIDFYADWCGPCQELERFTYTNPKVIAALDPFVRLKVDLTRPENPEAFEVVRRFNIMGVPTVIFISPSGEEVEDARISGFVSPEELLMVLKSVPS